MDLDFIITTIACYGYHVSQFRCPISCSDPYMSNGPGTYADRCSGLHPALPRYLQLWKLKHMESQSRLQQISINMIIEFDYDLRYIKDYE